MGKRTSDHLEEPLAALQVRYSETITILHGQN